MSTVVAVRIKKLQIQLIPTYHNTSFKATPTMSTVVAVRKKKNFKIQLIPTYHNTSFKATPTMSTVVAVRKKKLQNSADSNIP